MKMPIFGTLLALIVSFSAAQAQDWPQKLVSNVSVADIRSQAVANDSDLASSTLQTQALYGERLVAFEESNGWYRVELSEQQRESDSAWIPLQGWIRADQTAQVDRYPDVNLVVTASTARVLTGTERANEDSSFLLNVSMGTKLVGICERLGFWKVRLNNGVEGYILGANVATVAARHALSAADLRSSIVQAAQKFDDSPYLLGGRSFYNTVADGQATGVDSSGFINLVYRAHALDIPRNVQDQFAASKSLKTAPAAGDLVFLQDSSGKPVHVLLIQDKNRVLEATGLTQSVRSVSAVERLGRPLDQLRNGDIVEGYKIQFGSFISFK